MTDTLAHTCAMLFGAFVGNIIGNAIWDRVAHGRIAGRLDALEGMQDHLRDAVAAIADWQEEIRGERQAMRRTCELVVDQGTTLAALQSQCAQALHETRTLRKELGA